jgi:putative nucleotidyltransferase with HDIG domain|nr:HDOD domain-containing protein [Candidatus Krumholzibacteria bacterium]
MSTAVATTEVILKKIKDLPSLPLVVNRLLEIMEQESSSAEDISNVLSGDQALAAKVLKLVNSSFYGLSGEVSTISRAVVVLGVGAIRNLAMGLSIAQIMVKGERGELQKHFWDHSITTATATELLARQCGYPDPEEAFIAGLLHDIGHLVLLLALPQEFLALTEAGQAGLVDVEKAQLGLGHHQVGQKVLKHWKLPHPLVQAARFHHHGPTLTSGEEPLTSLVGMADTIAGVLGHQYEKSLSAEDLSGLVTVTGLELETLSSTLEQIVQRIGVTCEFLQIATDQDLGQFTPAENENLEVTLIGSEIKTSSWARQILEFHGHDFLPMKSFFAQADRGTLPDVVLLDPASVTDEQLARMMPVLQLARPALTLLGVDQGGRVARALGFAPPSLPLGFSAEDLKKRLA